MPKQEQSAYRLSRGAEAVSRNNILASSAVTLFVLNPFQK
jgi:hypothetical protein